MGLNQNRFRNYSLACLFGGFFIMYLGVFAKALIPFLMCGGGVLVVIGLLLYFRYGPVNRNIQTIACPRCGHHTRLSGSKDACQFCQQPLQLTDAGSYEPYVP